MTTQRAFVWLMPTCALAMVLSVGACGRSTPEALASEEMVASAAAGSSGKTSDTGSMAEAFALTNPDIASTLPAFVQMPNGSRVITHFPFSNAIRRGGLIMANTPMSHAEVLAFHRQALTGAGLVVEPEVTGKDGETVLTARSVDQTSEYVVRVFPPSSDGTLFSVNYFEPEG